MDFSETYTHSVTHSFANSLLTPTSDAALLGLLSSLTRTSTSLERSLSRADSTVKLVGLGIASFLFLSGVARVIDSVRAPPKLPPSSL
ncbi:hypothetical protein TeGR_g12997 [Tetraparma gracilis]|uniref:Uncharacterized protein n=1 Tax=Tetraparma gracilis TaxID=2962635 RepID=A0ABQ6MUV2_9STRA|nr:hypothetical protein TeGR_g12997 [Tetraparma gracilis]